MKGARFVSAVDKSGDSDELEALFDSIVQATNTATVASVRQANQNSSEGTSNANKVFSKIGQMTRRLHDTLRELGYDKSLEKAVSSIPDTRDRLNYIATLTEQAAVRALSATEIAKPIQEQLEIEADKLSRGWERLFNRELSVDEFKRLVEETRSYLGRIPQQTQATNAQLLEIMMAQDFQDLTGQVIKKIVDVAQDLEQQLVQLLLESTPPEMKNDICNSLLNGPVINADGRTDIVTDQSQVDDLLESLGF